jgi:1,4-dihydroxy-2-naphthoate octaprenyltransferase
VLGAGSAQWARSFDLLLFLLCALVAVSLQVGVNFANDYSDGVRGTDKHRVGPPRLTGSGLVEPQRVKRMAFAFFALALVAGFAVVLLSQLWFLLIVGALSVLAAWLYTGGSRPYGYQGLGEVVVFLFFGIIATTGTAWVMVGQIPFETWFTGSAAGFFAAAVLLVNNLRDREQDAVAGKRTLAVMLGDRGTRILLVFLLVAPYAIVAMLSFIFLWAPFTYLMGVLTAWIVVVVVLAKTPRELIQALSLMSLNAVGFALILAGAIAL